MTLRDFVDQYYRKRKSYKKSRHKKARLRYMINEINSKERL